MCILGVCFQWVTEMPYILQQKVSQCYSKANLTLHMKASFQFKCIRKRQMNDLEGVTLALERVILPLITR